MSPLSELALSRANDDDNQKTRRTKRGGRFRRVWRRWSSDNPVLFTLLMLFLGLCLICMAMEHASHNGPGVHRHSIKQRMRRAKALFHQATTRRGESESSGSGDDRGESEGDDRKARRARKEAQRKWDHHVDGFQNHYSKESESEEEHPRRRGKRYPPKDAQDLLGQIR